MVRWDEESTGRKLWLYRKLLIVFVVWAMHAIANLVRDFVPAGNIHSNVDVISETDALRTDIFAPVEEAGWGIRNTKIVCAEPLAPNCGLTPCTYVKSTPFVAAPESLMLIFCRRPCVCVWSLQRLQFHIISPQTTLINKQVVPICRL